MYFRSFCSLFACLVQARRVLLPSKPTNNSLPKKKIWKAFPGFKIISLEIFLCTSFQNTFFFFSKNRILRVTRTNEDWVGGRVFCQVVRWMWVKETEMWARVIVIWSALVCPSPNTCKIFSKQVPCDTWQAKSYYYSSPRERTCQMETLGDYAKIQTLSEYSSKLVIFWGWSVGSAVKSSGLPSQRIYMAPHNHL